MQRMNWKKRVILILVGLTAWVVVAGSAAAAAEIPMPSGPPVVAGTAVQRSLAVGESVILDFQELKRAAISDPNIADVVVVSTSQLLMSGKSAGSTVLYVWDKRGRWTYQIKVSPTPSRLPEVISRVNAEIGVPTIRATEHEGVLVLEGTATSAYQARRAETIAGIYAKDVKSLIEVAPEPPKPGISLEGMQSALGPAVTVKAIGPTTFAVEGSVPAEQRDRITKILEAVSKEVNVVNLLSITPPPVRQILVRAKVVDIDKSALKDLGVEWGRNILATTTSSNALTGETSTTSGIRFVPNELLFGESLLGPSEHLPLDGGPIFRLDRFGARLKALITENKARILSEPNLLVKEGEKASILVGGEIPIPVAQSTGAAIPSVSVEWKEFGVRLAIQGNVLPDGKTVDLMVAPEVSTLDFGNAISVGGIVLPALKSRKAETKVQIKNGQTLVIGGLFSSEDSKQLRKIPFLGDIPILGELFRSHSTVRRESELMIFVTPEIVPVEASS